MGKRKPVPKPALKPERKPDPVGPLLATLSSSTPHLFAQINDAGRLRSLWENKPTNAPTYQRLDREHPLQLESPNIATCNDALSVLDRMYPKPSEAILCQHMISDPKHGVPMQCTQPWYKLKQKQQPKKVVKQHRLSAFIFFAVANRLQHAEPIPIYNVPDPAYVKNIDPSRPLCSRWLAYGPYFPNNPYGCDSCNKENGPIHCDNQFKLSCQRAWANAHDDDRLFYTEVVQILGLEDIFGVSPTQQFEHQFQPGDRQTSRYKTTLRPLYPRIGATSAGNIEGPPLPKASRKVKEIPEPDVGEVSGDFTASEKPRKRLDSQIRPRKSRDKPTAWRGKDQESRKRYGKLRDSFSDEA